MTPAGTGPRPVPPPDAQDPAGDPDEPVDGPVEDRRLMAAHVAGDPDAFAALVRRHQGRLWAVALRTMRDPDDAADALQDALVSAFRHGASYRGDAAVSTWLHRIVVNACLDRVRRRRARPTVPIGEHEPPEPGDPNAGTEARLDVHAALSRLPEHQRLALVLVDLEDLPVTEAARLLGVAEGTVKSRCARGRAALAVHLDPDRRGGAPGGNPEGGSGVAGPTDLRDATAHRPLRPDRPDAPERPERPPSGGAG